MRAPLLRCAGSAKRGQSDQGGRSAPAAGAAEDHARSSQRLEDAEGHRLLRRDSLAHPHRGAPALGTQRLALSFGVTHPGPRMETRQGHRPPVAPPEAGFTLVELLIVMPFLLIVTTLMMVTLSTAYGAASQVQSTSNASSQVTLAFMTLDSEIRYAADINEPGSDASSPPNYYVEFESNWEQSPTCTQLEYANSAGKLLQRSWIPPASAPSGWQILASGMQTSYLERPILSGRSARLSMAAVRRPDLVGERHRLEQRQSRIVVHGYRPRHN